MTSPDMRAFTCEHDADGNCTVNYYGRPVLPPPSRHDKQTDTEDSSDNEEPAK